MDFGLRSRKGRAGTETAHIEPAGAASSILDRMRHDWDARAEENARFYIASGAASSEEVFRESGRHDLDGAVLDGIELHPEAEVLEIGCGVGRLLVPLSERVARAYGVDISPAMIERARTYCAERPNVSLSTTDGTLGQIADAALDFVYSYIVFQHIPAVGPIAAYLREAARVLRPGGLLRFQVDGRHGAFRSGPETYDGVKLRPGEVCALVTDAGLEMVDSWGEETHYFSTIAVRTGGSAAARLRPRVWDGRILGRLLARVGAADTRGLADEIRNRDLSLRSALGPLEEIAREDRHDLFVAEVYRRIFGREADERQALELTRLLNEHVEERSAVVDALVAGSELRGRICPVERAVPWFRREGLRDRLGATADEPVLAMVDVLEDATASMAPIEFFEWGYRAVLGHAPDVGALDHYVPRLTAGTDDRRIFLRELLTAPVVDMPAAPSSRRVETLLLANGIERSVGPSAEGEAFAGESLLARTVLSRGRGLPDGDFVGLAYVSVLGRPADTDGARYYVGQIGSGEISRVEFVRQLLWSRELRG